MPSIPSEGADALLPVARSREHSRDTEFAAFMAEAEADLKRTAWLLCGDALRAEELVQQALVRTYVAWSRARTTDPFHYARRAIVNARIDGWRKHRREHLTDPQDLPVGSSPSPEREHADRDQLVRALARLSPQRRRVVVLRYLLDASERQVADDLGISVGAVKSAASRGLTQMRSLLAETDAPTTSEVAR